MAKDGEILPAGHGFPLTVEERLTAQFYAWERRGRGWQVWEYPVELEPPFRPFIFHYTEPSPSTDDARRPTLLSNFVEGILGKRPPSNLMAPDLSIYEEPDSTPELYFAQERLVELHVSLPSGTKIVKDAAERVLVNLTYTSFPIAFEVVSSAGSIVTQFACLEPDRTHLEQQLIAHFPEATITEHDGFLEGFLNGKRESVIVDFGLSREFMLPIRTFRSFDIDPLIGIVGALVDVREGELGLLQVLFQAVRHPWAASIMRAVTDGEGHSFLADAPEMVSLAREKIAQPLFAVVVRVAAFSETEARAWTIAKALGGALTQFASPSANEFIPLSNDGYEDHDHAQDVLTRSSHRSGMLLNLDELASFTHLPSASVRVPQLKREEFKTKAAPEIVKGHRFTLGENVHAGHTVPVGLTADQRTRHCYLIGTSGTGKSTLLLNMILQDIEHGEGVAVLDPHGDLIDEILGRIPEQRVGEVVLLDPSDEAYPVGFNVLQANSEIEKNLLGSDLVAVFRRLSTSWGDQMTSVLGNGVLAFLESTEGGSLIDLRRFLVDTEFRAKFLKTVRDPEVIYYWEHTFPLLVGKGPQGPILTRLDTFLRPKLIRYMVAQKKNRFDLADIMNGRKIFLAKLAQGTIGEENAYLLGTLLVSKFQQLAMSRQQMAAALRRDFYLYVDEFHNFVTPSMAAILSGARKYRLGLILAHQELQQLTSRDADVASAVIANPYTRICFRLGDYDAKKLAEGFSFFEAKDLQNLQIGEAVCRVERAEFDFNLRTHPLPAIDREVAQKRREQLVALSRERYARPREVVEAALHPEDAPGPPQPKRATVSEKRKKESPPVSVTETRTTTASLSTDATQIPGRGGPQHKYLQDLIRRWAEDRGYSVAVEKTVLDGLGIVDLVLERRGASPIACEISVTTSPEHELQNAAKCLAAGFEHVFLIAPDKDTLNRVRTRASSILTPGQMKKVRFVTPEQIFSSVSVLESRPAVAEASAEPGKELLTAREVEELLRIDVKTIYSYVQRGLIPYVRMQSNLRFVKSEVLAWVAEHSSGRKTPKGKNG
jgi:predicted DNA-binding transcriptional regulator AlpA